MGELVGGMLNSKRFYEEFREPQKVDDGPKPDDHYETFEGRFRLRLVVEKFGHC